MPAPADRPLSEVESEAEDARIIRQVQDGQREAFEVLVRKYMKRAHGIAIQMTGNGDDALDLAQESFLKAFRAMRTFDTAQRFFPWFYRILRNTCLTFLKRRGLVRKVSLSSGSAREEPDWELVDPAGTPPEAVLCDGEMRERFWTAFRALGLREREILTLRHFEDLSYRDIADALEIPIGTVMSRLFHARRKLRDKLEAHA
jgi:RNA polymerase sigma-70 factor (ECF subfamily)